LALSSDVFVVPLRRRPWGLQGFRLWHTLPGAESGEREWASEGNDRQPHRDGLEEPGRLKGHLERAMAVLVLGAIVALTPLACWIAYLLFCHYLVKTTKDAASLKHAATAAQAFRGGAFAGFAQALGKLLTLRGL
jgi:hypothetical protein